MKHTLLGVLVLLSVAGCSATTESDVRADKWLLTLSVTGTGSGKVTASPPGGEYATATLVTITATPDGGSVFTGWDAAGPAACLTPENPCTTGMNAGKSAIAVFAPADGVRRFDGDYIGSVTTKGGTSGPAAIRLTIINGIVQGTVAGMYSPSPTPFSGSVSASGAFTASLSKAVDGICPATTVSFSGQVTTPLVAGITTSVISGSFGNADVPQGCGSSATMSVHRRTVPFAATGV